jgi:ABC-2 type transport system permease protein
MKLIQFELKKMLHNKRFIYLIAFIILFISALFLRNHLFQVTIEQERETYILANIEEAQQNMSQLQQTSLNNANEEKTNQMEEIVNTLYELQNLIPTDNWQQELKIENEFLMQVQAYKTAGGEFSLSNDDINKTLALNMEFLEKNIKPQHSNYSKALPNFLKQTVDILINFGVIIILLIMVGDTLTAEFKQRSIHFLYTQPIKKRTIIRSKFWSAFIIYVIVMICGLTTASCISFFFGEQGTFSYPVLIEQSGNFSFMTIEEYLIIGLTSVTAVILLTLALCLFVSSLFKNTFVSLFFIIGTLIGGYTLFNQLSFANKEWFNPFQYVIMNETITEIGYNWYEGIGITLGLAFLCYLLTLLRIRFVRI